METMADRVRRVRETIAEAAVSSGRKPEECVALACAEGACCVTTYDTLSGLKPLDELEEKIRKGW